MEEESLTVQDLQAVLSEWDGLLKSPGWKRLEQLAKDQFARRLGEALHGEHAGMDGVLNKSLMLAEAAGFELFMKIPSIEAERLREEINNLRRREANEDEPENDETSI